MYNFADSTVTASAFTAGANTGLTLVASTAGLTTTAALVIYYDDQLQSTAITISNFPASQAVTFGQAIVSASNITGLNNSVGTDGSTPTATNFIKIGGHQDGSNQVEHIVHVSAGGSMKVDASDSTVTFGAIRGTVTVGNSLTISSLPAIFGTVTANVPVFADGYTAVTGIRVIGTGADGTLRIQGIDLNNLPSNLEEGGRIPVSGTVTAMAGTNFSDEISEGILNFQNNEGGFNIGSLPAISGTVTANTFAVQGTAVTTSNFTSTTASTVLANFNATREVLTIFNEGAGNLHIAPGATCTTVQYQVRLSSGDYYEVPNHQTTITHSAVFATAGTARICQVS
jgi:hypothetical protein